MGASPDVGGSAAVERLFALAYHLLPDHHVRHAPPTAASTARALGSSSCTPPPRPAAAAGGAAVACCIVYRRMTRAEIEPKLPDIDRSESRTAHYRVVGGALTKVEADEELPDWPPAHRSRMAAVVRRCIDNGGAAWGAFANRPAAETGGVDGSGTGSAGSTLVGICALDGEMLGASKTILDMAILFGDTNHRGAGIGKALFARAVAEVSVSCD